MELRQVLIAEIGSVHDGSFGNACRLIETAADCGAHAVKFQTHIAEAETLATAPNPAYFQSESRIDYFLRTGFSEIEWRKLFAVARDCNVLFLSSPFSLEAVDLLESLGMEVYKIPSGEVSNLPLIERIAATGKPTLLSSGMSNWEELDLAVAALRVGGQLTIMQCSSRYPCPPELVGLNVLGEMSDRYGVSVGYSDHTLGLAAPIAAAALGATVIEKHFTFSRLMYGSDAQHSMEPTEFRLLANALREVWTMMASPIDKSSHKCYAEMKHIFEKSIVTTQALPAGKLLERTDLAFKKPGSGIKAKDYQRILGKRLRQDVAANHMLAPDDFE